MTKKRRSITFDEMDAFQIDDEGSLYFDNKKIEVSKK